MSRLRLAVIGVGHLGKIHAKLAAAIPEIELVAVVVDFRPEARERSPQTVLGRWLRTSANSSAESTAPSSSRRP